MTIHIYKYIIMWHIYCFPYGQILRLFPPTKNMGTPMGDPHVHICAVWELYDKNNASQKLLDHVHQMGENGMMFQQ